MARLGGDEFAVIQTAVRDQTQTMQLLAAIYQSIRQPIDCSGHLITTDASIGIAVAPTDGLDLDQLLRNADLALYRAKDDGGNEHRNYEPALHANAEERRHRAALFGDQCADPLGRRGAARLPFPALAHLSPGGGARRQVDLGLALLVSPLTAAVLAAVAKHPPF